MDVQSLIYRWGLALLLLFAMEPRMIFAADAPLPEADKIMARVIARSDEVARAPSSSQYQYARRHIIEELDGQGEVTERKDKEYEVVLLAGWPYSRLVKVDGKPLSKSESDREATKERKAREEFINGKKQEKKNSRDLIVSEELIARYEFKVEKREIIEGRPALVISFKPRAVKLKADSMADEVLNRLAGTLWVDEEEAELIRADLQLGERVNLWGGFLGTLETFKIRFQRKRLDDGVWVNQSAITEIRGRKFLQSMHYQSRDESSDYRRVANTKTE